MPVNSVCRLAARPLGLPKPSDWEIADEPAGSPADGEFLVRVEYLSVDPAMRTWSTVPFVALTTTKARISSFTCACGFRPTLK